MNNLRRLRHERGLTSREAAAHVGVSRATICRLETGQPGCMPLTRAAIERFYGAPLEDLLSETTTTALRGGR